MYGNAYQYDYDGKIITFNLLRSPNDIKRMDEDSIIVNGEKQPNAISFHEKDFYEILIRITKKYEERLVRH